MKENIEDAVYSLLTVSVFIVIGILIGFKFGRDYGYGKCQDKFLKDYKYQDKKIDTLQLKTKELRKTYDSIKATPCYELYYSK